MAVKISIKGYNNEIFCLQCRHVPRNKIHERTGILSYHAIIFLQCGHKDRKEKKSSIFTKRYAITFKNDPQHKKSGIKISSIIVLRPLFYRVIVRFYIVFQMLYRI